MLYMALRYPGGAGAEADTAQLSLSDAPDMGAHRMGRLADLLRWHAADPVDAGELRRNGVVAAADLQANRNPFVDVPALADLLFGGQGGAPVIARLRGLRPLQRERQCDGGGGAVLMRDIETAASAEEVQSQSEAARAGAGGAFCFCLQLVGGDGGGRGGGGDGGGGGGGGAIVDAAAVAAAVAQQRLLCGSSGGVAAYRGVDAGLWAGLVAEARTAQRERVCFCS